jgi:hypothetical protein
MKDRRQGMYNPHSPYEIHNEKHRSFPDTIPKTERLDGSRFCEGCRTRKPANDRPHVKGWRCDDCFKR